MFFFCSVLLFTAVCQCLLYHSTGNIVERRDDKGTKKSSNTTYTLLTLDINRGEVEQISSGIAARERTENQMSNTPHTG